MSDNILKKVFQPSARGRVWRMFVIIGLLIIIGGLIDAGSYYNRGADWIADKTGQSIKLPHVSEVPFRLGLDLQGGSHLVYQADMSEIPDGDKSSALEGVRDVIERRVNVFGVSEPIVQTSFSGGEHRVIVELAGIKDVNEAIEMIGETPLLEFKEETNAIRELTEEERAAMDELNSESEAKAEEFVGKMLSNGDFEALVKEYSYDETAKQTGGDLGWVTKQDNPTAVSAVENFEVGDFTKEITKGPRGYEFYELEDKRVKKNPFSENETEKEVKASHLLLCYEGIEGCTTGLSKEETYEKIKNIKEEATPRNFKSLVVKYTTEPGGAEREGELGWFGKGDMVKPFEDTVFSQEVGTISYVVETQFGYHLIYKEDEREQYEYKVRYLQIPTITEQDIINDQREWKNTELTGKHLARASVSFDPNDNSPQVSLEFDSEGADLFAQITERNVGKPLGIFLDKRSIIDVNGDGRIDPGEVYAPTINEKITGGRAVISGMANIAEAKIITQRLNAGALPVPINLINQQTVGATLGKASLTSSLKAGLAGLLLVAIFMVLVYRLPGLLAVLSLAGYGILIMAIFKIWPVTLSLAGLAGFILSIGMAVDANVLIFERLKEELKDGLPLGMAIENSFSRAWPSIRDGNMSTLITCFILIQFSTSIVKGFAITLGLGVMLSMFSAIVITKTLLQLVAVGWFENNLWLIGVRVKKND